MRVQGLKKENDGWSGLEYRTTYKMGWMSCLAYVQSIYPCMEQVEILASPLAGVSGTLVDVKEISDIKNIPEAGVIEIRGRNKIYDGSPFQFVLYNQTDIVRLWVKTEYLESLKKNETEFLNEEEQKHIFDKFMDSVELNGTNQLIKDQAINDTLKQIETAFNQYSDSKNTSNLLVGLGNGAYFDLSKIINKIKTGDMSNTLELKTDNDLQEYSQEIPNYPTFKFYFPKSMGEYAKQNDNVFELKKDNIQKIRVMISKCNSEESFANDAKNWIEKNKKDAKMEEVAYKKEKIKDIPIEVYELKYINREDLAHKIYKIGYVNGCRITISGGKVNGKEEVINKAFEMITWNEITTQKQDDNSNLNNTQGTVRRNSITVECFACKTAFEVRNVPSNRKTFYCTCPNCGMELKQGNPNYEESKPKEILNDAPSFMKKWENDLKTAFLNCKNGNIKETIKQLDDNISMILRDDKTLNQDVFWKFLSSSVFKAVVLNNFYNQKELTPNDIDALLANQGEVEKNIKEFCNNFKNNEDVNFISQIQNINEKMLKDVIRILMINIGKMNIKIVTTKTIEECEIKSNSNNKEKIITYLIYVLKNTEKRALSVFEKLSKYEDICNEFANCINGEQFNYCDNGIIVEGYSAKSLKELVGSKLSDLGVYNYLIYLREEPDKAKEDLAAGLPIK